MSALFDFRSFEIVVLLTICTCTYVKMRAPQLMARTLNLSSQFYAAAARGPALAAVVDAQAVDQVVHELAAAPGAALAVRHSDGGADGCRGALHVTQLHGATATVRRSGPQSSLQACPRECAGRRRRRRRAAGASCSRARRGCSRPTGDRRSKPSHCAPVPTSLCGAGRHRCCRTCRGWRSRCRRRRRRRRHREQRERSS